ncbi:hypothetical protein J1N35_006094 [Gossypium stocksii]|uniref:Uncharacterized protein n=1 Tax=Gossypium stocksii TaxID=47602 RepID=A0A9D3WF87_9ROSI|nr:hypothetical protein J1N35_006094 [Gossypium stocksii]
MNHHDKDREKDKERSSFGNHWARDSSNPLGSIITSKTEILGGIWTSRDEIYGLWRSHLMIYGKQGEPLHQRTAVDSRGSGISNHYDGNGLLYGDTFGSSINKAVFEKDFKSLDTKEGFSSVSQSLPVGNSTLIDGEGWTLALVEVPSVDGSSGTGSLPASLIVSTSGSGCPSVTAGLNMVEALTQAPSQTHTVPGVTGSVSKFLLRI